MLLDNIYVINLDRSKDRLNKITKNLNEYGINFTRFPAVEGKKLNKNQLESNTTLAARTILCNYAEIGCALSHIQLWEKLLNDSVNYYLVIEDDAVINDQFKKYVLEIDKIKGKINFDILSLYSDNKIGSKNFFRLTDGMIIEKSFFRLTTVSYIISRKGASKLLSLIRKVNYPIDFEIAYQTLFHDINHFTLNKNIVEQNKDIDSTIRNNSHQTIVMYLIKKLYLNVLYQKLNAPIFTIFLTYSITPYFILLVILLVINIIYFHNIYLYIFILIELVLYFL